MSNPTRWVGIDLHRRRSQIAIIDHDGELTVSKRIATAREPVAVAPHRAPAVDVDPGRSDGTARVPQALTRHYAGDTMSGQWSSARTCPW